MYTIRKNRWKTLKTGFINDCALIWYAQKKDEIKKGIIVKFHVVYNKLIRVLIGITINLNGIFLFSFVCFACKIKL